MCVCEGGESKCCPRFGVSVYTPLKDDVVCASFKHRWGACHQREWHDDSSGFVGDANDANTGIKRLLQSTTQLLRVLPRQQRDSACSLATAQLDASGCFAC